MFPRKYVPDVDEDDDTDDESYENEEEYSALDILLEILEVE